MSAPTRFRAPRFPAAAAVLAVLLAGAASVPAQSPGTNPPTVTVTPSGTTLSVSWTEVANAGSYHVNWWDYVDSRVMLSIRCEARSGSVAGCIVGALDST